MDSKEIILIIFDEIEDFVKATDFNRMTSTNDGTNTGIVSKFTIVGKTFPIPVVKNRIREVIYIWFKLKLMTNKQFEDWRR